MKTSQLIAAIAAPTLLIACGGESGGGNAADSAFEDDRGGDADLGRDDNEAEAEAAKRRESMIATWGANFGLTEEQATCLVDNVQWDDMIAAEQSEEVIAAITACDADPATFAGYGR